MAGDPDFDSQNWSGQTNFGRQSQFSQIIFVYIFGSKVIQGISFSWLFHQKQSGRTKQIFWMRFENLDFLSACRIIENNRSPWNLKLLHVNSLLQVNQMGSCLPIYSLQGLLLTDITQLGELHESISNNNAQVSLCIYVHNLELYICVVVN